MRPDAISRLRSDLAAARFTVDGLESLWGTEAGDALTRGHIVPAARALADDVRPAAVLAQLFVLGRPVDRHEAERALPSLGLADAQGLGLVGESPDGIRALLDLRPYAFVDAHGAGEWWIASDLGELALGGALPETHVLGVGGASATLSGLMIDRPIATALDLGTGCGIQALHAARHADRVVATDISALALELASFNARLNGVSNIEVRRGSLYEPVAGERFDHIVSNPPFVITPRAEGVPAYEYRDAGLVGDALVRDVVVGAAEHLEPGGVAQLLANWEYAPDGLERVRRWVAEAGLDAWVVEREVQSPERYAETWIRDGGTRAGDPAFDLLYSAWLDDFASRGVRAIGFGYVLLRRPRSGRPALARFERLHEPLAEGAAGLGTHLAACLDAHDWQAALEDDALGRQRLVVAPDVTEERHHWPGSADPAVMALRQGSGFGRSVPLDTALAALVGACDGELALDAIIAALAQLLASEDDPLDEAALRAELLPRVRELLVTGFLLPPSP